MRSDLVFEALCYVPNRYQLCQLASKAARRMHKPNTRLPDTANHVLSSFNAFNLRVVSPVQVCNVRNTKDISPPRAVLSLAAESSRAILERAG